MYGGVAVASVWIPFDSESMRRVLPRRKKPLKLEKQGIYEK